MRETGQRLTSKQSELSGPDSPERLRSYVLSAGSFCRYLVLSFTSRGQTVTRSASIRLHSKSRRLRKTTGRLGSNGSSFDLMCKSVRLDAFLTMISFPDGSRFDPKQPSVRNISFRRTSCFSRWIHVSASVSVLVLRQIIGRARA